MPKNRNIKGYEDFLLEYNGLTGKETLDDVRMEKKGCSWYVRKGTELIKIPSVTTILSMGGEPDAIRAWRERIGEEAARRISDHAKNRGTVMHRLLDVWFGGNRDLDSVSAYCENQWPNMPREDREAGYRLFTQMVEDGICDRVRRTEEVEYPIGALDNGGYWGLIDFVATFTNGEKVIVDFKSASRKRMEDTIDHYKRQLAAYFHAWEAMKGERVHHAELWISYEEGDERDEVITLEGPEIDRYVELFLEDVKAFHRYSDLKMKRSEFEAVLSDSDKRRILKAHGIDYSGPMDGLKGFLRDEKGVKYGLTAIMSQEELDFYKNKYDIDSEIIAVLKGGNEVSLEKEMK